jgi:hypothetical protein
LALAATNWTQALGLASVIHPTTVLVFFTKLFGYVSLL